MEHEERVVNLAKPMKKGILRLIFSRFFLIVLLFLLELAAFVSIYLWFAQEVHIFLHLRWIFTRRRSSETTFVRSHRAAAL